jgi:hypothetical protein
MAENSRDATQKQQQQPQPQQPRRLAATRTCSGGVPRSHRAVNSTPESHALVGRCSRRRDRRRNQQLRTAVLRRSQEAMTAGGDKEENHGSRGGRSRSIFPWCKDRAGGKEA